MKKIKRVDVSPPFEKELKIRSAFVVTTCWLFSHELEKPAQDWTREWEKSKVKQVVTTKADRISKSFSKGGIHQLLTFFNFFQYYLHLFKICFTFFNFFQTFLLFLNCINFLKFYSTCLIFFNIFHLFSSFSTFPKFS